jgi:hypothetical protein
MAQSRSFHGCPDRIERFPSVRGEGLHFLFMAPLQENILRIPRFIAAGTTSQSGTIGYRQMTLCVMTSMVITRFVFYWMTLWVFRR